MDSQKVEIDNFGDNNFSKLNPRTVHLVSFRSRSLCSSKGCLSTRPTILAVLIFTAATASLCVTGFSETEFWQQFTSQVTH